MAGLKKLNITGKKVLSIDFGEKRIKYVVGTSKKNGSILVEKAGYIETPEEAIADGCIVNHQAVEDALGKGLEEIKPGTRNVVCTVETSRKVTRELMLPVVSEKELLKILEYDIVQSMPVDLKEYFVQSKIEEKVQDEGVEKYRFTISAIPRESVEGYFDLLTNLALKPKIMDLHSNALSKIFGQGRHINDSQIPGQETIAILDFGYRSTNLVILKHGVFQFNRLLSFGSSSIDDRLMEAMGVNYGEAINYKCSIENINAQIDDQSLEIKSGSLEDVAIGTIQLTLDNWMAEINRIFRFFATREEGNRISSIYLTGGLAEIPGIDLYFENSLGLPSFVIESLSDIEDKRADSSPGLSSFVNALGAMLRQ